MSGVHSSVTREQMDAALARFPDYMRPIILAVRDHGCTYAVVAQRIGAFDLPADRPRITLIGDDDSEALGPKAFHGPSLRKLLSTAKTVSIVAGKPTPLAYGQPAAFAVGLRVHGVIIETRPEQEIAWTKLVQRQAPDALIIVTSVRNADPQAFSTA